MSFRLRIALTVFVVVMGIAALQAVTVLARIRSSEASEQRANVRDELREVLQIVEDPILFQEWIDLETTHRTKWSELFVEVRDRTGQRVAGSTNLPPAGIPDGDDVEEEKSFRYWTVTDPTSRSGHRRMLVAQHRLPDRDVRVARTLKRSQKRFWIIRERLAYGLFVISLLGTIAAWIVTTRVLSPIREMVRGARALSVDATDNLALPGTGDELDELAGVLNEFLARARAEVARMRRLLDNTSHALRSPLTVLHGALELRLSRARGDEAEELASAVESTAYLTRLVNRLLRLAALESGQSTPTRIDLGDPVQAVVEYLKVLARDKTIELKLVLEPAPVCGDASQLREAAANLIENAIRHTPSGGSIEVHVSSCDSMCRLEVQDSGPGLSEEQLERVFERFYTASEAQGGTGLGLPIARTIARSHGGTLRAFSYHGARFVLELPRADDPEHKAVSAG